MLFHITFCLVVYNFFFSFLSKKNIMPVMFCSHFTLFGGKRNSKNVIPLPLQGANQKAVSFNNCTRSQDNFSIKTFEQELNIIWDIDTSQVFTVIVTNSSLHSLDSSQSSSYCFLVPSYIQFYLGANVYFVSLQEILVRCLCGFQFKAHMQKLTRGISVRTDYRQIHLSATLTTSSVVKHP